MLSISVTNERQRQQFDHPAGPFEFGRGVQGEIPRFVIDDGFVSRDQLRIEELPLGHIRLKNLSARNPVILADGSDIPANQSREVALPVSVTVGETVIAIAHKPAPAPPPPPRETDTPAVPPRPRITDVTWPLPALKSEAAVAGMAKELFAADGYLSIQPVRCQDQPRLLPGLGETGDILSPATLARWMESVLALQRSDAGPTEFYSQAAQSMVEMIGLDVGLVLLHGERGWQVVARAAREDEGRGSVGREYSQTVLRQVLAEKQTFYQDLALMKSQESLKSVDAVVVSPIFALEDEVVGALYGMRRGGRVKAGKVHSLEAQLVQLLAAAVGANLARSAATRTRTQFEQFFSADLVRELTRDPRMLEGRGQDVTILVSDLRGFSTISEKLGPQDTCRLVRDIMERLSERVAEHAGVIVSYLGDGLLAMWNAPASQVNHAVLACRAALAILAELPALNADWQPVLGSPLRFGLGLSVLDLKNITREDMLSPTPRLSPWSWL